ncbi:hypothetical protein [Azospirillum picis]|uniref:Transposase n=1 Tax=Azospirillum picis TaxID=488438 RepID=A0ABU0MP54_9PROT|nr:hypothetical protein [Azospirillum picis]MBP2301791.1 hypothetical protein [Azospirillum picis]MDQ0535034.1 hypothetical protein [Azospirillum picis]
MCGAVLLHAMIAVYAETQDCPGLLAGQLRTRPEKPPVRRDANGRKKRTHSKAAFEDREAHRWIETAEAAKQSLGEGLGRGLWSP